MNVSLYKSLAFFLFSLSLDDYNGIQSSRFLFQQHSGKGITQNANLVYNNNGGQKMLCSTNGVVSILNDYSVREKILRH